MIGNNSLGQSKYLSTQPLQLPVVMVLWPAVGLVTLTGEQEVLVTVVTLPWQDQVPLTSPVSAW